VDELKEFLGRPDAHELKMLPVLNVHLRRVALALVSEMVPIPRRNREQYIRGWLAQNLDGLPLWEMDKDEIVDHILVKVGRRAANGDTLGYVSYDSYCIHGWRSCPRLWGRPYRITRKDDPSLLDGEKCRFCWSEKDQRRLDEAAKGE
jgi:hypothetical protein